MHFLGIQTPPQIDNLRGKIHNFPSNLKNQKTLHTKKNNPNPPKKAHIQTRFDSTVDGASDPDKV